MRSLYDAIGILAALAISTICAATLKSTGLMTMASTPCVITFSAWPTCFCASLSADCTMT
jgi:hypothetical protein